MDLPSGWISSNEQRALADFARQAESPFLEVGPWLGRSTIVIARELEVQNMLTVELNPTSRNFSVSDETVHFHIGDEWLGSCSLREFDANIRPHLGLVWNELVQNLTNHDLQWIRVLQGDFATLRPRTGHKAVYLDVTHNSIEIKRTFKALPAWCVAGAQVACHDISDEALPVLEQYMEVLSRCERLVVGRLLTTTK